MYEFIDFRWVKLVPNRDFCREAESEKIKAASVPKVSVEKIEDSSAGSLVIMD